MVDTTGAWCLERNDRQVVFSWGQGACAFAETAAARQTVHSLPAWKLVLPLDGARVAVSSRDGRGDSRDGLLLPPRYEHSCTTDGPYVALFLEAWMAPPPAARRPRALGPARTRRLLDALALGERADLDAGVAQLAPLVGPIGEIDGRLATVMGGLATAESLDGLSATVGLSPSRLRALVRSVVGAPLTHLRLWSRLQEAMTSMPHVPTAVTAAVAGFSDQPHLTRTARRLLGRTPAEFDLRNP
jgi:AraC-like DNA-binding protein